MLWARAYFCELVLGERPGPTHLFYLRGPDDDEAVAMDPHGTESETLTLTLTLTLPLPLPLPLTLPLTLPPTLTLTKAGCSACASSCALSRASSTRRG